MSRRALSPHPPSIVFLGLTLLIAGAWTGRASAQEPDLYDIHSFRTVDLQFYDNDWWNQLERNYQTGKFVEADLRIDGILYRRVGVAFRGQLAYWTDSDKKPLKVKTDAFIPDQEVYGVDTMRLNNGSEEPTFTRTAVMANVLGEFMPMPRVNYVKVYLQGKYWGVYINEEVKDQRWMKRQYRLKFGNRYKFGGGDLSYLGDSPGPYKNQYELQNEPGIDPWQDLIEFCDVLNNSGTGPGLTDALWQVCDIDGSIWEVAGDNVFANLDSYYVNRNNYFVMSDHYHGLMELVNHDFNLCLGTWRGEYDLEPNYQFTTTYPFVRNVMEDKPVLQEYYAHVLTLTEEALNWDVLEPLFQQYQDLIRDAVYADKKKIFTDADFTDGFTKDIRGEWFNIPAIEPYVKNRHDYLMTHPQIGLKARARFLATSIDPVTPRPGEDVQVLATIDPAYPADKVELRWRVRGPFERVDMYDDGQNGDGAADDGVWGAVIPGLPAGSHVDYYFVAVSDVGNGRSFEPNLGARGAFEFVVYGDNGGALRLNEFVADNQTGEKDEFGERDDWVEIVNRGTEDVSLDGLFLSDDILRPDKWPFPSGLVLRPGDLLSIWCDNQPEQGPLHADFGLAAGGEDLILTDTDGFTVLDSLNFGPMEADQAIGRLFDGDGPWVTMIDETYGALNDPGCGTRRYDAVVDARNPVRLKLEGTAEEGEQVVVEIRNGPPSGFALLYLSGVPTITDLGDDGVLLLDLAGSVRFLLRLNALGELDLPATLPDDGSLTGIDLYAQTLTFGLSGELALSNAFELEVCSGQ